MNLPACSSTGVGARECMAVVTISDALAYVLAGQYPLTGSSAEA